MRSVFLDHYFRGFHDSKHRVALFEFQFVGAAPGDHAFNEIVANLHDYVSHHIAQLDFLNGSTEVVSG